MFSSLSASSSTGGCCSKCWREQCLSNEFSSTNGSNDAAADSSVETSAIHPNTLFVGNENNNNNNNNNNNDNNNDNNNKNDNMLEIDNVVAIETTTTNSVTVPHPPLPPSSQPTVPLSTILDVRPDRSDSVDSTSSDVSYEQVLIPDGTPSPTLVKKKKKLSYKNMIKNMTKGEDKDINKEKERMQSSLGGGEFRKIDKI